ncbi:MAG: hypothetical protein KDA32_15195 [Phycisphaerales bacterium]|nr:hypothetical protein [Phycisphaerales bacterium]
MAVKPLCGALAEFFAKLDAYQGRVPLDVVKARLQTLDFSFDDVAHVARFDPERYRRNLLHAGPGYHALILCWLPGQRSPIHDHAQSTCGVRVLKGICTETVFERNAAGYVYPTETRDLPTGGVCGSQDSDLHQVSNLQGPGEDLVTMHVYSPPLLSMRTYSLTDTLVRQFVDPISGFCFGDGI